MAIIVALIQLQLSGKLFLKSRLAIDGHIGISNKAMAMQCKATQSHASHEACELKLEEDSYHEPLFASRLARGV